MATRQKVLFYGNSLVLSGMQASLTACPWFDVIALDGLASEADLLASNPNVVIFDMGSSQPEFRLAQMQAQPGLLLIGIDTESHEVLLTGQAAGSITLDQITQIMRSQETDPIQPSGASA